MDESHGLVLTAKKLKALLKEHLTLDVGNCCNDPEHEDCLEIRLLFDGDEIARAQIAG